jgi:hypothetical protein
MITGAMSHDVPNGWSARDYQEPFTSWAAWQSGHGPADSRTGCILCVAALLGERPQLPHIARRVKPGSSLM